MTRAVLFALCVLWACSLGGCGYLQGTAVYVYLDSRDDDDDPPIPPAGSNGLPSVNLTVPTGNQFGDVPLSYLLIDPDGDPVDITVTFQFSNNGGASWTPVAAASEAVGLPSEGVVGLSSSPSGTPHVFVWNSFADVGGEDGLARITIQPFDQSVPAVPGTPDNTPSSGFPLLNKQIATVSGAGTGVLSFPGGIARDGNGNLYISDTFNHRVQVLNTQPGTITVAGVTIAPNQLAVIAGASGAGFNGDNQVATLAQLNFPNGIAVDGSGNVYVADTLNHRIRRIDTLTGFITTAAGTGTAGTAGDNTLATTAQLDSPVGVAVDTNANLYIADSGSHALRVVNTQSMSITVPPSGGVTVAPNFMRAFCGTPGTAGYTGDNGAASGARLDAPQQLAFDSGGHLYVADRENHVVRAISWAPSGSVSLAGTSVSAGDIDTVAGNGVRGFNGDGAGATGATFDRPRGVALDANDNLFVVDTDNGRVRAVNAQGSQITVAGVMINPGDVDTVCGGGTGAPANDGDGGASTAAVSRAPESIVMLTGGHIALADTGLSRIRAVNVSGSSISVAGVSIAGGQIENVAGSVSPIPLLLRPFGNVRTGNSLCVSDTDGRYLFDVNLTTGSTSILLGTGGKADTGDGGPASSAATRAPRGMAIDPNGNVYFVSLGNGNASDRVRVINRQATTQSFQGVSVAPGNVDLVARGVGGSAFNDSPGIGVDGAGNLYIAHRGGDRIMLMDNGGTLSALVGGTAGYADGALGSAQLTAPEGVSTDAGGNLLIADTGNHAIRYVNLGATSVTVCGISIGTMQVGTLAGQAPPTPQSGFNGDNQLGTSTLLNGPSHAFRDGNGHVFFVDGGNQRVRRIDQVSGIVTTVAGTGVRGFNGDGKPPGNAHLNDPTQIFLDTSAPANCFVADGGNRRVRRFAP